MEKPKCKKCNSSQVRVRIKTNERVCSSCGYIEKLEETK